MFDTPYQTTSMQKTILNQQGLSRVRTLEINGDLVIVNSRFNIKAIKSGIGAMDVLPFTLPLTKRELPSMEADVIIDARSLLKANGEPIKKDAWDHMVRLAELTAHWVTSDAGGKADLLAIGNYPVTAYAGWLTNLIVSSMKLDITESLLLRATTAVFYCQQFMVGTDITDRDVERIITRSSRALAKMDFYTLSQMLGEVPRLNNLTEWLVWSAKLINSPKFDRLTPGVLLSSVNSTWGPGYADQARTAVEYPPAFIALAYSTLIERSYSKTRMGELLHKIIRSNEDRDFIKSINNLLRG